MRSFGPEILAVWWLVVGALVYLALRGEVKRQEPDALPRFNYPLNVLLVMVLWPIYLAAILYNTTVRYVSRLVLFKDLYLTFYQGNNRVLRTMRENLEVESVQLLGRLALKTAAYVRGGIGQLIWNRPDKESELNEQMDKYDELVGVLNRITTAMHYAAEHPDVPVDAVMERHGMTYVGKGLDTD